MAGASGKGISAAVRGAVREWMTDDTVNVLFMEYEQLPTSAKSALTHWAFKSRIREADEWVRIVRTRGIGFDSTLNFIPGQQGTQPMMEGLFGTSPSRSRPTRPMS